MLRRVIIYVYSEFYAFCKKSMHLRRYTHIDIIQERASRGSWNRSARKGTPKQKNGDAPDCPGIEQLPIERVQLISSEPAIKVALLVCKGKEPSQPDQQPSSEPKKIWHRKKKWNKKQETKRPLCSHLSQISPSAMIKLQLEEKVPGYHHSEASKHLYSSEGIRI